jgi:hypothetical protein
MEEQSANEGGVATATRQGPAEPAGLESEGERKMGMEVDEKKSRRDRDGRAIPWSGANAHTGQNKKISFFPFLSLSLYININ